MPTYDYRCNACGHAFEKFHSMSAAPIRQCPECGKKTVKRIIGAGAGIIFKGTGFYQTDYKTKTPSKDSADKTPSAKDKPCPDPAPKKGCKDGGCSS